MATDDSYIKIDVLATQGILALKALREIHFYLYPELYPRERAIDHGIYDPETGPFEWSADTIEGVGEMVCRALADDPATPKGS